MGTTAVDLYSSLSGYLEVEQDIKLTKDGWYIGAGEEFSIDVKVKNTAPVASPDKPRVVFRDPRLEVKPTDYAKLTPDLLELKKKPKTVLDVYQIDNTILSMLVGSATKIALEPGQSHSFEVKLTAVKAITVMTPCPLTACVSEDPVAKIRAYADLDLDAFFRITSKAAEIYPLLKKK
jgi:hypothetical protein